MNEPALRAALNQIRDSAVDALSALDATTTGAAVATASRAPLGVDSLDVREWSDAVGRQTLRQYQRAAEQRTPGVVSPWDALALWANRPQTTDADAETIRRSRKRLAERFQPDEPYAAAIGRALAENAALPGDPNAPGFLTGEKA